MPFPPPPPPPRGGFRRPPVAPNQPNAPLNLPNASTTQASRRFPPPPPPSSTFSSNSSTANSTNSGRFAPPPPPRNHTPKSTGTGNYVGGRPVPTRGFPAPPPPPVNKSRTTQPTHGIPNPPPSLQRMPPPLAPAFGGMTNPPPPPSINGGPPLLSPAPKIPQPPPLAPVPINTNSRRPPPDYGQSPAPPHSTYTSTTAYTERPKIDPSQIPRPPSFTRDAGTYFPKQAFLQQQNPVPPPADARYSVQDDGNASPDIMRSTVYNFPTDGSVWHKTGDVPLGVLCSPLSIVSEDYQPQPRINMDGQSQELYRDPQAIPVIGLSNGDPPRCHSCYAYANPFSNNDKCCLCQSRSMDRSVSGYATQFGTVEYEVAGNYVTRDNGPVQNIHLFALDLTSPDVEHYLAILEPIVMEWSNHIAMQAQFQMGSNNQARQLPRIGVCLVCHMGVIVWRRRDHRCVVMSDVDEPFASVPLSDWTFGVSEVEAWQSFCRTDLNVKYWKQKTAKSRRGNRDGLEVSCGGAALHFLADSLATTGGRGAYITCRRPNSGAGCLEHDCAVPVQTLAEKHPVESKFYKDLAAQCGKSSVTLDVVMHTRSAAAGLGLPTLGELCRATCGHLSWINAIHWKDQLAHELKRPMLSFGGWDAVFKVRCSEGIQVNEICAHSGNVVETMAGPELELSCVRSNTCIAVELDHRVGGLSRNEACYVQTALLYTNQAGKRRVRVSTLALKTSSSANEVYRSVDMLAVFSMLSRQAASCEKPEQARMLVYNRCIRMLADYRVHTPAKNSSQGQLILPEKMQLLPLYCMCLLKSAMIRPAISQPLPGMAANAPRPTPDERAFFRWHLSRALPTFSMLLLHPNVYAIHNNPPIEYRAPEEVEQTNGYIVMPDSLVPSMESLEDDGVYLVDDGFRIYLYVGNQASDQIKASLFEGEPSAMRDTMSRLMYQMRTYSSPTRGSESDLRPVYPPLVSVLQSHSSTPTYFESEIFSSMVTDANTGEKDYVDFLCTLHRRVRERVEAYQK